MNTSNTRRKRGTVAAAIAAWVLSHDKTVTIHSATLENQEEFKKTAEELLPPHGSLIETSFTTLEWSPSPRDVLD